ncbi:hypothetical protein Cgig2_023620 [Carnegiea gigantea]|uniref:Reverse transcriptase zinc-binding domain-containing protein n=1 Tax=Carnegiea gigantea TaxID=171969 RepID=A0A9Q1QGY1_9CARY|nr:hypothetical protein Cgig2_023620 [Carnegiea gigantea]
MTTNQGLLGEKEHHRTMIDHQVLNQAITSLPRHSFTAWMFMHQKLPVLSRVGRYTNLQSMEHKFCHQNDETQEHLFFECQYAAAIWEDFQKEWGIKLEMTGIEPCLKSLTKLKQSRKMRWVIYALITAVTYNIWKARNHLVFKNQTPPPIADLTRSKGTYYPKNSLLTPIQTQLQYMYRVHIQQIDETRVILGLFRV